MSPKIKKKYNKKVITHATLRQNKLSLILIMGHFVDVPSSSVSSLVPDIHWSRNKLNSQPKLTASEFGHSRYDDYKQKNKGKTNRQTTITHRKQYRTKTKQRKNI